MLLAVYRISYAHSKVRFGSVLSRITRGVQKVFANRYTENTQSIGI